MSLLIFSIQIDISGDTTQFPFKLLTSPQTAAAQGTDRGRVKMVNNTVVADNGYPLRGEAIFLTDNDGSTTGNFTLNTLYDLAHWRTLRDDFHLNTVRFFISRPPQNWPNGPGDNCGPPLYRCYELDYLLNPPDTALDIIDDVVDIASRMGMYIIIDYHPVGGHNEADAVAWWSQIAPRYKDRTHVIYELANEPVAWSPGNYDAAAVAFQENLYQQIRAAAPETHIILWTFANGSAGMLDKVNEGQGISYANASVGFHPYGGYSEAAVTELKAEYPVINTEIGGNNRTNVTQAMENLGVSWILLNGTNIPGLRDDGDNAFAPEDVYWPADPDAVNQEGGFTLNATPSTRSIDAGGMATYTIQVQPAGEFTTTVTLTADSPSPNLTLDLSPATVGPPGQATLTLTDTHPTDSFFPPITYTISITAAAGDVTQTTNVDLIVNSLRSGFILNAVPSSRAIDPGETATYTLHVQPSGDFTTTVMLMAQTPSPSLTLDLGPQAIDPPGQATLTLTDTHPFTSSGSFLYKVPITATADDITQTTGVILLVGGERVYLPVILKGV